MNDYDFSRLNDKEFEVLCADLIGAMEGVRFERFKPGRDNGVDGRYFEHSSKEWVIQCKHWVSTPYSRLIAHLRDIEAPKAAKLNPQRYFLAISKSLSRENKTELSSLFSKHMPCPVDILGREDLNDLLSDNSAIEKRHFKLWITSTNVLTALLNNAIKGRSEFMMKDIIEKSKIFVATQNYQQALNTLEKLGTIIITGQAGIGKTTLAEQIILHFACNEFELICISQDITEAEQAYDPERPQLFYFDDFLGRNYLQALTGHEGSQIVNFIKRIGREKHKKKFILTSRSTILNQGKILNDVFDNNNIDRNELEIRLTSLSSLDKAHILYNHIWHSNLPPEHIDEFYPNRRYRHIIEHKNFNPRIISFITDQQRVIDLPPSQYWRHVMGSLDNPSKIWEHPFESQLDDFGRLMVSLVALNGKGLSEQDLTAAYARAISTPLLSNMQGKRDFYVTVRHLTNSMLNRVLKDEKAQYNLFNPSLGDFLLHRFSTDTTMLETIFKSLRTLSALKVLLDMSKNNFINNKSTQSILLNLFNHEASLEFNGCDPEYISKLCLSIQEHSNFDNTRNDRIKKTTNFILSAESPGFYEYCAEILTHAINLDFANPFLIQRFVISAMRFQSNSRELPLLGTIINHLEKQNIRDASQHLATQAQNLLITSIDDIFDENEIFELGRNASEAHNTLKSLISAKLNNWGIYNNTDIVETVSDFYDIPTRIEKFLEPQEDIPMHDTPIQRTLDTDDIDDLFQRHK